MRVAQHRGDLGARRPGPDLGDGDRAVGPPEPFHVGEPGAQPQRPQRGRRDSPVWGVPGPADVAGQQDRPLHPRVAQHLQRGRQVVRDRVPDDLPVDHHAVVGALLPGQELLDQRGPVRGGRGGLQPRFQVGGIIQAERALGPGAGGRLDHQREADLAGEIGGSGRVGGQPVPGAGHARGPQHRLHLVLVPEVAGRGRVHAGDAQVLADLGQRHLQLLQHGQQPLHRAQLPPEPLDGPGDLAGVERVVDPPVPGQACLAAAAGDGPRARW